MTRTTCEELSDRIVDYVDGELTPEEARVVARHLSECPRCRQTANDLERSLRLVRVIWQDNLVDATGVRSDAVRRYSSMGAPPMSGFPNAIDRVWGPSSTAVPAGSPTGILPVDTPDAHGRDAHAIHGQDARATHGQDAHATICPHGHTTNLPRRRSFYGVAAAAAILLATGSSLLMFFQRAPQPPVLPFEEIQRQVVRAGTAAQLLAATRIVAQCEGTESIVEQQYRYILREYAGTPAAASIGGNHDLKLGGTQND